MKTLLLIFAAIFGVLGSPAISNNLPQIDYVKETLTANDQNADANNGKSMITAVEVSGQSNIYNTLNATAATPPVLFCTAANFLGKCYDITYPPGCFAVPTDINNQISSAYTRGACVIAFDGMCSGKYMTLSDALGTGYVSNFQYYGFNDVISSFAGC